MNAIADCARAIKDINSSHGAKEMQQLVESTKQAIQQHSTIAKTFTILARTTPSDPRVKATKPASTQAFPRVQETSSAQHQTRSMSQSIEHATRQIVARAFLRTMETPTTTPPTQCT